MIELVLFQKKIGDGIELKDNKYLISIYPEDTNDFEYKQYVYDTTHLSYLCLFWKDR